MTTNMMINKIETLNDLEERIEMLKAQAEEIRNVLKDQMTYNNLEELQVGDYVIRYIDVLTTRFDTKRFKESMGSDIYNEFTKQVSSKRFSIAH